MSQAIPSITGEETANGIMALAKTVPTCDGTNNAQWHRCLQETLNSRGLYSYADGTIISLMYQFVQKKEDKTQEIVLPDFESMFPPPSSFNEDCKKNTPAKEGFVWDIYKNTLSIESQLKFYNSSKAALAVIEKTLNQSYKAKAESLGDKRNPQQVLDLLLKEFKQPSQWKISRLERKLHSLSLHEDGDPKEYLDSMRLLIDDAVLAGIKTAVEHPERLLIAGLPDSYENAIKSIEFSRQFSYSVVVELLEQDAFKFAEKKAERKRKAEHAMFGGDAKRARLNDSDISEEVKFGGERRPNHIPDRSCNFCGKLYHRELGCFLNPASKFFRPNHARSYLKANPNGALSEKLRKMMDKKQERVNVLKVDMANEIKAVENPESITFAAQLDIPDVLAVGGNRAQQYSTTDVAMNR